MAYDKEEYARIKKAAEKIKDSCDAFIVIGIGGSYLGSKAVITALTSTFFNEETDRKAPKIYFAGENISGKYMKDLIDLVKDQDICVNVISKSGTTTEPAIAFRFFKEMLEKNTGRMAPRTVSLPPQTRSGAPLSSWPTRRAMKPL